MTGLSHELRLAARGLRANPGITAIAVVTMALGIGSTAFMFSIVHGALYRGLPFPDGARIMRVDRTNPTEGFERMGVTFRDYLDFRDQQGSFGQLAGVHGGTVNVTTDGRPLRLSGSFITANGFRALGVRPYLGRGFLPGEDAPGQPPLLVLSYDTWRDEFGADTDVVGHVVRVNGEPSTVIGVMPEGFRFPDTDEAWIPLRRDPLERRDSASTTLIVYGKLRDGISLEAAQAEFSGISARLATEYPETNEELGVNLVPFTDMGGDTAVLLLTMLGAVALVLLVACTNVANLLLSRTATRTRDIAVRTALGAGRRRIVGLLVAEAAVLAGLGAVLGTGIAWAAMEWFDQAVAFTEPPFWFVFAVDGPILLFVVAVTAVAAVVAGLIPGLKASGARVQSVLQDNSRGASSLKMGRLSRGLVMGEIALSVGLLVVAGLMGKAIIVRRGMDFPFATESVFTARIGLFESEFPGAESRQQVYDALVARLAAEPGVAGAALTNSLPGLGSSNPRMAIQGEAYAEEQDYPRARYAMITPGFFETFEVTPTRGRVFTDADRAGSLPVALANESFAAQLFGGDDPIGRQVRVGTADSEEPWRTIVGVVPDLYMEGAGNEEGNPRGIYVPLAQEDTRFVSIAVRTRGDPMAVTPMVRRHVLALAPDTPLYWVWTLQHGIDRNLWVVDVFGGIFIVFGFAALLLAIAGLYGVTSFSVGRRVHEVGIRMALGAGAGNVMRMILRQGAVQIAVGLVGGLGLAALLSMALQEVLFRVEPFDPVVFAGITLLMAVTAMAASAIPARRAGRLHPATALRDE